MLGMRFGSLATLLDLRFETLVTMLGLRSLC
jgi:hypothetical protein